MSELKNASYEGVLRRKFEEEFRASHAARLVPRLICYLVFCPLVILGFFAGSLEFERHSWIAILVGGWIGMLVGVSAKKDLARIWTKACF